MRTELQVGFIARQQGYHLVRTNGGFTLKVAVNNLPVLINRPLDDIVTFLNPPKPKVERVRLPRELRASLR